MNGADNTERRGSICEACESDTCVCCIEIHVWRDCPVRPYSCLGAAAVLELPLLVALSVPFAGLDPPSVGLAAPSAGLAATPSIFASVVS